MEQQQKSTTRPLHVVGREEPHDPNGGGPTGATLDSIARLVAGLSAKITTSEEMLRKDLQEEADFRKRRALADAERDRSIGACLAAASKAASESAQTKAIVGRVEGALGRIEDVVTRLDATVGRFPATEDVIRAMHRESQRDITPEQMAEKEARIRDANRGTGLCGMIMSGAHTDVVHAEQIRTIAAAAGREGAKEIVHVAAQEAAVAATDAASEVAKDVAKQGRGKVAGVAAVASTGTLGVLVFILYTLGPEGGARVAGAIRGFLQALLPAYFG